jgi:hypothetical protein
LIELLLDCRRQVGDLACHEVRTTKYAKHTKEMGSATTELLVRETTTLVISRSKSVL